MIDKKQLTTTLQIRDQGVGGSNPLSPTIYLAQLVGIKPRKRLFLCPHSSVHSGRSLNQFVAPPLVQYLPNTPPTHANREMELNNQVG